MSTSKHNWLYKKLKEKDNIINNLNKEIILQDELINTLDKEIKENLSDITDLTIIIKIFEHRLKKKEKNNKKQQNRYKKKIDHIQYLNEIINKNFIIDEYIHKCAICLDNINNINNKKTLECEHSYHKECINKVKNKKCPLCQQSTNRI